MKKLCILGLGYIGLPTAALFATHGIIVHGMDVNQNIVKTLQRREIHIEEPGLKPLVLEALKTGQLTVSDKVEPSDVFIIAVPTPFKKEEQGIYKEKKYKRSDMDAVSRAAESIVPVLERGNLVILESTSPIRTTIDLLKPILEKSGLIAGRDFSLAYSPERVLPGQIIKELVENSRVIGGIDKESSKRGGDFYSAFVKGEIILTDTSTAEMIKLMENTYRDVNIAIANEFALIAERMGVNIWEAISVANRHPRVRILNPGPGVGGHCIAIDPWFLVESAPDLTDMIYISRKRNDSMPQHVVDQIEEMLTGLKNPIIACLGLTYKANVDDIRESPAIEVVKLLMEHGFIVRVFDPHAKSESISSQVPNLELALNGADLVVFLVPHTEFTTVIPSLVFPKMRQAFMFDACGITQVNDWRAAGFQSEQLGAK